MFVKTVLGLINMSTRLDGTLVKLVFPAMISFQEMDVKIFYRYSSSYRVHKFDACGGVRIRLSRVS